MLIPEKKNFNYVFLLLAFLAIFGIGFRFGQNSATCRVCAPEQVNFSLFWDAWNAVHEKYVNSDKLDTQKLIYGAISGMVNSIGDPYTTFLNPDQSQSFMEEVTGQFEGIGIEVGIKDNQLQVISPLEETPAKKAGLMAGDKIIKINGEAATDMTIDEAVKAIKGKRGTQVTLTIFRSDWDNTKDFKITRDVINIPSVKLEFMPTPGGQENDVAYLKIYQFSEKSDSEFARAANKILQSKAKKIILDLRNNPGGYLEVSQNIAGWFLEDGKIVVSEDFNGKETNIIYKAQGNSRLLKYPIVILINQGSASASEILAAALRDNRKAQIIGETSYGKGSVQEVQNLSGKSSIKITVANWLTPKGNHINNVGLAPDVEVKLTEDDYKGEKDPQLAKALEILKDMN